MEILHENKKYSVLGASSSIEQKTKKSYRKNSALLENIQKNNIDYSKENKFNKNNNLPKTTRTCTLSKIKKLEKKEELRKNSEDNNNNNIKTSSTSNIIDDNIKMLFLNLTKSANLMNSILNIEKMEKDITNNLNVSYISETETNSECDFELKEKTADKIRFSYIQKLVSKEFYLPKNNNSKNKYNSLIIFDWDDTLFPTSFLAKIGYFSKNVILAEIEGKILKKIQKLEKAVIDLINLTLNKGDVYIITNAMSGWVEYSSSIFYPTFYTLLPKIKIISARGEWENIFPNDIKQWKIKSFSNLRNKFDNKLVTNIICLGDSMLEIEAGRFLANYFKEAFIKTIKFKEEPKPDELNKQLILVTNQFNKIHSTIKSLTVRVEKK